ncbi:enoyl-CoA hydratase-related protein [Nocardioides sp. AE5]|uniref:enoyl-CoA hydratase-related protein n=1 Tax=Nocardioides sp. AE5 TaxID=2962573 RepID=UPI0028829CCF|nr:enoyl-CoA hydratase-related protein [Nocardioides sp. AE5]MDT0203042.1 enoyl-CoA hydratase-related protein [Nocardioides sp. AE5]
MSEKRKVHLDRDPGGLWRLTLDDPEKRNAIGPRMREELLEAAGFLRSSADVRCLVVTGAGAAFCAGADLLALFDGEDASVAELRERQLSYYESFLWLRELACPTIAAVNGHAIGAGLNLALACDIVVAGKDARFGATFSRIGLHPGGGCTHFMTERMGPGRALRTLLLGATLCGEDALRAGLADEYADDALASATALGEHVASLDARLAADIKRTVVTAGKGDYETTVVLESWAQAASAQRPEVLEGIRRAGRSTVARS